MSNRKQVKVCQGMSCSSKGSGLILDKIKKETGLQPGEENDKISLDTCTCTGHCYKGPNILVDSKIVHGISPSNIISEIQNPTDFSDTDTQELNFDLDKLIEL